MIQLKSSTARSWWLLLSALLAVAVMMADAETGSCAQASTATMAKPGLCPPLKVHVPYPGFTGNYGVNAMYRHEGADSHDTHPRTPWYRYDVPASADHPSSRLVLQKVGSGHNGQEAWKLVRYPSNNNNTDETHGELVSQCASGGAIKMPWKCTAWDPAILISEMSWTQAHDEAVQTVKEALRYAEEVKLTSAHESTGRLQRAAKNVKDAITAVRQLEEDARQSGHDFTKTTKRRAPVDQTAPQGVDEIAKTAAEKAEASVHPLLNNSSKLEKAKKKEVRWKKAKEQKARSEEVRRKKVEKQKEKVAEKMLHRNISVVHHHHNGTVSNLTKMIIAKKRKALKEKITKEAATKKKEEEKKLAAAAEKKKKLEAKKAEKAVKHLQAKAAKTHTAKATLSLDGISPDKLKDPRFRRAFLRAAAKAMGADPDDVAIVDDEQAAAPAAGAGNSSHAAATPSNGTHTAVVAQHSSELVENAAAGVDLDLDDADIDAMIERDIAAEVTKRLHLRQGRKKGAKKGALLAPAEELAQPDDLVSILDAAGKPVNITLKVATKDHEHGAAKLKALNSKVSQGVFDKELKAEAAKEGIPLADLKAAMVHSDAGPLPPTATPTAKPKPAPPPPASNATAVLPPPNVPRAPAPPTKLPDPTRWDQKGKTGTFTRCASAPFGGHLMLLCPRGTTISKVLYADLGTAQGPWCGWTTDSSCSFPDALPLVQQACTGKKRCTIPTDLNLLAVKAPEPASRTRLDMEDFNEQNAPPTELLAQEVVVPEMEFPEPPPVSPARSLLANKHDPVHCWAKSKGGVAQGRLVVRALCKGKMDEDGLLSAPSMALGKVSIAGLPKNTFLSSAAYKLAFARAVEAAMCQCDVSKPKCVNDGCAGNVEIHRVAGDAQDTDIEFKVRVPPTRSAAYIERVLSLELHSESALYAKKEKATKAQAKTAAAQQYHLQQAHEQAEKARLAKDETKTKLIATNKARTAEAASKEKEKKVDAAKWADETKQKERQKKADVAQDEAAKASERSTKAHYLHQEARTKKAAAKEVLDKKLQAAAEVQTKAQEAKASFSNSAKAEQQQSAAANEATTKFIAKHNQAEQKVSAAQSVAAEVTGGTGGTGTVQLVEEEDDQEPTARSAAVEAMQDSAVSAAVDHAMAQAMEMTLVEEVAQADHPSFPDNFAAACKEAGVTAPAIGTSVSFFKAQQASGAADAAQLGMPPPKPEESYHMASILWTLFLLLLLLCVCCFCFCFCRPNERSTNPYKSYGDDPYHDDLAYQRSQTAASGQVDANGLPILGGDRNAPIGVAPVGSVPGGGASSRALLNQLGQQQQQPQGGGFGGAGGYGGAAGPTGPSEDPRRELQKRVNKENLEQAMRELNAVPWYKRQAVQSRINELLKWQKKLEDESRPLYASAGDPTSGFPTTSQVNSQRAYSQREFELARERSQNQNPTSYNQL